MPRKANRNNIAASIVDQFELYFATYASIWESNSVTVSGGVSFDTTYSFVVYAPGLEANSVCRVDFLLPSNLKPRRIKIEIGFHDLIFASTGTLSRVEQVSI